MAAHVAALSGALAAAAAASQAGAAESRGAPTIAEPGASAGPNANDGTGAEPGASANGIGDLLRVSSRGGNCGCAPCWGPPAPPAMTPELFALFDDVEVAS